MNQFGEYEYATAAPDHLADYLWEPVLTELRKHTDCRRILDLGCGNGAFANHLAKLGFEVVGIDPSQSGIAQARLSSSSVQFVVGSAYDELAKQFGQFDCVISLEVVEHLYSPAAFVKNVFELLRPGGIALVSTPYHGYFKNLCMAITGKLDQHFTALWEHGHIKFWSVRTLTQLLTTAGLSVEKYLYAGRFRYLAKSMVAVAIKPDAPKPDAPKPDVV